MKLRDKINQDVMAAMKAKNSVRLAILRIMKAAVKNKEIDVGRELEDAQVVQVLSTLVRQGKDALEQFQKGDRPDLVSRQEAEIAVIEEYLPPGASEEEIARVVREVVAQTGAASVKDMGTVMKRCLERFAGRAVDGKKVNAAVSRILGKK